MGFVLEFLAVMYFIIIPIVSWLCDLNHKANKQKNLKIYHDSLKAMK